MLCQVFQFNLRVGNSFKKLVDCLGFEVKIYLVYNNCQSVDFFYSNVVL